MTIVVTHTTPADSSFSTEGAAAWNADHALSGVGTMAEQNADNVAITGGSINNTVIGNTTPNAATFTTLTATGQTSLGGAAGSESLRVLSPSSVGTFAQFQGGATGVVIRATGDTGTNSGFTFVSRGTQGHLFSTGGSTTTVQAAITHTASAVNYVQVTGAATGSGPTISAQGSDANARLNFVSKGGSAIVFQTRGGGTPRNTLFLLDSGAASVNYVQIQSTLTANGPIISAEGSDTNIDLALTPKGTGLVRFGTYTANMALTVQGYIEIKDSGGTTRKLAVIS